VIVVNNYRFFGGHLVDVNLERGEVVFEESYVVLGVSVPFVPEGPNGATFICVDIEPRVFTEEGEFTELDLHFARGVYGETKFIGGVVAWVGRSSGRAPSGTGM
jgi:hypothetical protein